MRIQLRDASLKDLAQLEVLSDQLGYPQSPQDLKRHFELVCESSHRLMVAELMDGPSPIIVGAALYRKDVTLFEEPRLEIDALVVDEAQRGHGIGKIFLKEADRLCREWGYSVVRLSSNAKRARAHEFYLREGFTVTKTSLQFEKKLR